MQMGQLQRTTDELRQTNMEGVGMVTQQGDLSLLNDPVAQQLLQSPLPARLAYLWSDGTPRVSPLWFHWNGSELVFGGPPDAPKMEVLRDSTKVAVTIDTDTMPYKVLTIRGTLRTELVEGVPPEYASAAKRVLGEEGGVAWVETMATAFPTMPRYFVRPEWVGILDFETRFPNAVERGFERAQAQAQA